MSDPSQNQAMSTGQMLAATQATSSEGGETSGGGGASGTGFEFNKGAIEFVDHNLLNKIANKEEGCGVTSLVGNLGGEGAFGGEVLSLAGCVSIEGASGLVSQILPMENLSPGASIAKNFTGVEVLKEFQGMSGEMSSGSNGMEGSNSEGGGGGDDGGSAFSQSSVGSSGMQYENDVPMAQMGGFAPDPTPSGASKGVSMEM